MADEMADDMGAHTLPLRLQWEVLHSIVGDLQSLGHGKDQWQPPPFSEDGREVVLKGVAARIQQRL